MSFSCPICKREVDELASKRHVVAEAMLLHLLRTQHPEWVESDGFCLQCLEEAKKMVADLAISKK